MSFKICIIGCGEHVRRAHGPSLEKYARLHPGVELRGCCDLGREKAESFRRKFAFRNAYTDWEIMLDREKPDALSLALPPQATCAVGSGILERGIPVLFEKPPGLTTPELECLIVAAERSDAPTQVAFNRRFTALLARAHSLLEAHFPRESVLQINYDMIRCNRRDPDFSTTAIHALDAVLFLARSPYREAVFNYRQSAGEPGIVTGAAMDGRCLCGTGVRLNFQPTAGVVLERASIHAAGQTVTIDLPMWSGYDAPGRLRYWRENKLELELSGDDLAQGSEMFEQSGFYSENEAFFEAVRHGRQPAPSLEESRQPVALMEAFRNRVETVEFQPECALEGVRPDRRGGLWVLLLSILAIGGFVFPVLAETPPPEHLVVDAPDRFSPTAIASAGQPAASIVIPEGNAWFQEQAERIVTALKKRGVSLPVEFDSAYRDVAHLQKNLILLGDRDSNLAIKKLYYLHYTLLDARYPGKGGSVVRSLHNPFGDGFNILFAGGSDETGVRRAVDDLIAELNRAPLADGNLQLGYLQTIHLGEGIQPPADAREPWLWERSTGYHYGGYFGWNLISRNLALFYMTGEERHAKEFLRLAFPDRATVSELIKVDKEAYDDPSDPLAKPYHYQAIMMVLYWDLVEESPVFTPETRLRVSRKFAEQFYYHWPGKGGEYDYSSPLKQTTPATRLADRHKLWDATCLYALARYFNKNHPCQDVQTALKATANVFDPFDRRLAIGAGTLYWYNTFIEPAFVYAALSDPLRYENNPVVREYANVLAKLSDRTVRNWSDSYSSPFFLNLVASMTGDQAFADLVGDTGQDTTGFRVGQSYWPVKPYPRNAFTESAGKVMAQRFDAQAMGWKPDFPPEEVTDFVSWRQTPDASGDYLLVDTKYEAGREPFHNFAIIGLRLDGHRLLSGYASQLAIYRDGLCASGVSRYAQVTAQAAVGETLVIRGQLKNQNGCHWRRTLLLRKNRFFLAFDEVTSLEETKLLEIDNDWRNTTTAPARKLENGEFELNPGGAHYALGCSLPAKLERIAAPWSLRGATTTARFALLRPMAKGETVSFATVLRPREPGSDSPSAAQQGNRVALRLPQPALVSHEGDSLLLTEADHVFGFQVMLVPGLLSADRPVDVDYDQKTRRLAVRNAGLEKAVIRLDSGESSLECPPGKTVEISLPEAPAPVKTETLASQVAAVFEAKAKAAPHPAATVPALEEQWRLAGSEFVQAIVPITHGGKPYLAIADGKRVVIAAPDGKAVRTIERADTVGALYWWPGPGLLLVGSKDDKLGAFDFDGREVWSHTAQMAPELEATQKGYWFKRAIPGVTALKSLEIPDEHGGREVLFVGGTGTVEILDSKGRLEKRLWQLYGAVDGFTPVPALDGQPPKMLCKRSKGGWPTVYEVAPTAEGWKQRDMGRPILCDLAGTDMGTFGFSMVGRRFLTVESLTPGEPPRIVGDFNGVQNRLMVWSLAGKALSGADLGPGSLAAGIDKSNYGRSIRRDLNVRGLAVLDLDGDGKKEIVAAVDRRYVMAFDGQLKQRFAVRLDASPVLMQAISRREKPSLIAVGDTSGQVTLLGPTGSAVATVEPGGIPTAMVEIGDSLFIGNDKGEVAAYALP